MNLEDIALFVQVVEQGSFTKAAALNDLPKSTISRRIRSLEDALHCRLLERTTRKLTLTGVGQQFLHRAYEITKHIEETQQQISQSQDDYSGNLTLYGPEHLFRMGTGQIGNFLKSYPSLSISIHTSALPLSAMTERRFDLMLTIGDLPDSSLIAVPIATLDYDLYISPEYLSHVGVDVTEEEVVATHNIAIQELSNHTHCWPHETLPLKRAPRFLVESPGLLTEYVKQGMAVGCLPVSLVRDEIAARQLISMFESRYRFSVPVYAVYHSRRYVPAKVKLLITEIREKLQTTIDELETH
ncbi:LysR family transcriptional regulator [Aliagarivorans marinus]|uniref:LysR family transcriptional regulator n=1 Tax=Aliagarivorans marinus TaxID=561965 RepID=UPI00047EC325|nr:LysR family transcriptional regulator [Aliagarivorans marinus]